MKRRIPPIALAMLIGLATIAPVNAAEPSATPAPLATSALGPPVGGKDAPDPTGRYIVMTRSGADTAGVVARAGKRDGVTADQTYGKALHGFAAKLGPKAKADLQADPDVLAIVPDEVIHVAATQSTPNGVSRVGDLLNPIAKIDGVDERVDADVAIVDTGITAHPDLNIAGGYNCSTADHTAWRDKENHGTHVAGIVGALDNGFGVVGVAPGVRLWAVKILNDKGDGLLSWYVCGLNWILAQRDPVDPTRPLFEAVNMSVTKYGSDDRNCGLTNLDVLHQAICRVVAGGITVVAAAANDSHNAALNIPASYDEVITVSALADTDGKPGGLGGNLCFSWDTYDKDDTFADFSNYGPDVDIMAPGKCIMSTIPGPAYAYMSGTSMSAPTVTGAVALYKASRPNATPAEVREALIYLGNYNFKTATDPDSTHEPLLDTSRIDTLGTFALSPGADPTPGEAGTTVHVPFTVARSATFFERVDVAVTALPAGWTGPAAPASVMGWTADDGTVAVTIPAGTPVGPYEIGITGTNQGRSMPATLTVNVVKDNPTALPPVVNLIPGSTLGATSLSVHVDWPAGSDPTSAIGGYQVQSSRNGGTWTSTVNTTATHREATYGVSFATSYRFRARAIDAAGNQSAWVEGPATTLQPVDDRSSGVVISGTTSRAPTPGAWRTTETLSKDPAARLKLTFSGRWIAVVGPLNKYRGKANVYVDGVFIKTLDMYRVVTTSRRLAFTRAFLTSGRHTIELRPLGTSTHPFFGLDAFVIVH